MRVVFSIKYFLNSTSSILTNSPSFCQKIFESTLPSLASAQIAEDTLFTSSGSILNLTALFCKNFLISASTENTPPKSKIIAFNIFFYLNNSLQLRDLRDNGGL